MPSFGLGELILIGIAIIVFVRPEDLPKFIRNFGRFYADMRRVLNKCQAYTQETLDEISRIDSSAEQTELQAPSSTNTQKRAFSVPRDSSSPSPNKQIPNSSDDGDKPGEHE